MSPEINCFYAHFSIPAIMVDAIKIDTIKIDAIKIDAIKIDTVMINRTPRLNRTPAANSQRERRPRQWAGAPLHS